MTDEWDIGEHLGDDIRNAMRILQEGCRAIILPADVHVEWVGMDPGVIQPGEPVGNDINTHVISANGEHPPNWFWRQEYESSFITVTAAENLPQATYTSYKPKHILDIHYPHKCHKCKRELYWVELYHANVSYIVYNSMRNRSLQWDFETYKQLKKLWRSEVVQFYCCECYRRFGEKKR